MKKKNYFSEIARKDIERSKEIEKELINLVNGNGGFIDLRDTTNRDIIYCVIYDMGMEKYTDEQIFALGVFDNSLCVLIDLYDDDNIKNASVEELLENDGWYSVLGGQCWINATIMAICESIEQYI